MSEHSFHRIGQGEIGGKGQGLVRMQNLLHTWQTSGVDPTIVKHIALPKTILITTDVFSKFMSHNGLEAQAHQVEQQDQPDCDELQHAIEAGTFPADLENELSGMLNDLHNPLAVRSSSLLEDQKGAAFAGKYESVLIGNQGSAAERKDSFFTALKTVFASTYNPNALVYRRKHGFLDVEEKMAVVVQEVVGRTFGNYFLPALAGVGFSQNGYCWTDEIKRSDGLVRLVFGLGLAAVGRGYVRLFAPPRATLRPEGTEINNIQKCSQKKVYVIDLETNELKAIHFRELIPDGYGCFPGSQGMVSLKDGNYLYQPVSNLWDSGHVPVLTMDGVLERPWMKMNVPQVLGWVLKKLEEGMGWPTDMEFAIEQDDETKTGVLYLLQARPLSEGGGEVVDIPKDLPKESILIHLKRNLPTAHVSDLEYLVIVDEQGYRDWPYREKPTVARMVGKLNIQLKGKRFALVGPGRWGSWNPQLGVPVNYSELCNCSMLIEVARREGGFLPEVSFGSHFFQDLIEDRIAYLPVHPGEPAVDYQEGFLEGENQLRKIMGDAYADTFESLIRIVHVPSATNGKLMHAILNGERGEAIVFFR